MDPETVLKIKPIGMTVKEVEAARDEWIREYKKLIKQYPAEKERGSLLIDRASRAAELAISRYVRDPDKPKPVRQGWADCDPAFYEEESDRYCAENDALNGDFPLGNKRDAELATPYFTIEQLARIQLGKYDTISNGHSLEPVCVLQVRGAFLAELKGDWATAAKLYGYAAHLDPEIAKRAEECRDKKTAEGIRCCNEAKQQMENGQQQEVFSLLTRAIEMENSDALVEMALCYKNGSVGFPKSKKEALSLLRKAAKEDKYPRACMELIKFHENDPLDVSGKEAQYVCEIAAEAGDDSAVQRLREPFDMRPTEELLTESAEAGNIDAFWLLFQDARKRYCHDEAQMWYEKAIEAGQADALLVEVETLLWENSSFYNKELAVEYLHRAAEQGDRRAVQRLRELGMD